MYILQLALPMAYKIIGQL